MIRRDYILRMVEELAQMLGRVVSLKDRQEYEQAMREIGLALAQLEKTPAGDPDTASLEHWLALCEQETAARGPLLIAVADLLNEQGELLRLQNKIPESRAPRPSRSDCMSRRFSAGTVSSRWNCSTGSPRRHLPLRPARPPRLCRPADGCLPRRGERVIGKLRLRIRRRRQSL